MPTDPNAKSLLQHAYDLLEGGTAIDVFASDESLVESVRVFEDLNNGATHYQLTWGKSHKFVAAVFYVTVAADGTISWKCRGEGAVGSVEVTDDEARREYKEYAATWGG